MLGLGPNKLRISNPARSLVRFSNIVRHGPITSTDLRVQEASDQILLTAAMGAVSDAAGIARAMLVPLGCFVAVLLFAMQRARMRPD